MKSCYFLCTSFRTFIWTSCKSTNRSCKNIFSLFLDFEGFSSPRFSASFFRIFLGDFKGLSPSVDFIIFCLPKRFIKIGLNKKMNETAVFSESLWKLAHSAYLYFLAWKTPRCSFDHTVWLVALLYLFRLLPLRKICQNTGFQNYEFDPYFLVWGQNLLVWKNAGRSVL